MNLFTEWLTSKVPRGVIIVVNQSISASFALDLEEAEAKGTMCGNSSWGGRNESGGLWNALHWNAPHLNVPNLNVSASTKGKQRVGG